MAQFAHGHVWFQILRWNLSPLLLLKTILCLGRRMDKYGFDTLSLRRCTRKCLDQQFWNTVKSVKYFEILKISARNPLESCVKNSDCKRSFKKIFSNPTKSIKSFKILKTFFIKIVFQNLNSIHRPKKTNLVLIVRHIRPTNRRHAVKKLIFQLLLESKRQLYIILWWKSSRKRMRKHLYLSHGTMTYVSKPPL
jgi:hypothetical protein